MTAANSASPNHRPAAATGNPAWDFAYFQRGYEVNRQFCFRARAVFRKFKDAEEIIHLYEQWSGEKVVRPDAKPRLE